LGIKDRLSRLRAELKNQSVDGFIIPHTDEFGSEYLPANAERLAWITGFTGSSGVAIILEDKAVAMTDGRYTLQIKQQVDSSLFEICDMMAVSVGDWLCNHEGGRVIGYDPKLHTRKQIENIIESIKDKDITLKSLPQNPIDTIWSDSPSAPMGVVELFPDAIAGMSSAQKRKMIAARLVEDKISSVILTLSDSICWLLNIRGNDIDFNPLVLSYAILHQDSSVDFYVDAQKIPDAVRVVLGDMVGIHPFEQFENGVRKLTGNVLYDDVRSSMWIFNLLGGSKADIVLGKDPCIMPKACKTEAEQLAIRQAHIQDGVAFIRFLFWLEAQDLSLGQITELGIEEKLEEFRQAGRTYRGKSFNTIAGWAGNGAIIHYHATPETNKRIAGNGFLLLDSGGQYEYGTTDITRTIVMGDVTPEMKDRFTRVMKGHIALATARFSHETDGAALDNLARQPLIDEGLNFAHGTGHGVGCYLCVHEEASSISPRGKTPFKHGMLVSNEPGYYKEGEFGIRHENLILCQEDAESGDLYFDTVTVVPFDMRGIDWNLMTETEKQWLDTYHHHVFETLSPLLDELELQWLQNTLFPEEAHEPTEQEIAFSYSAYD
jgi:Xaa-Pro aminopeptidase